MHKHPIDLDLGEDGKYGKFIANIEHEPLNDTHLLVKVQLIAVPKLFKPLIPKKLFKGPISKPVSRDFIRGWSDKFREWADEPAPEPAKDGT